MSESVNTTGYGYASDEVSSLNVQFGLNPAAAHLVKFEWTNQAGKDGAEAEALDMQFSIVGSDRLVNYRKFKVTKAFGKNNVEITDPKAPEFQKELKEFNASITHVLRCFRTEEEIKAALTAAPIANFKDFCKITMSLLPKDYEKVPLDIFFNWQWSIKGDNTRTFLEIPKKMSYGKWLCKAIPPQAGPNTEGEPEWKAVIHPDPTQALPVALKYVDDAGNVHPFTRNGWYMLQNFAKQQTLEEETSAGTTETGIENTEGQKSAWEETPETTPTVETPAVEEAPATDTPTTT